MAATLSSWIWGMIFPWANHFMCYSWFVMFPWGTMMQCNWRKGKTEVYQRCRPPRLNQSRPLYNQMLGVFGKVFSACPWTEISFLCVFQLICRWTENSSCLSPWRRTHPTYPWMSSRAVTRMIPVTAHVTLPRGLRPDDSEEDSDKQKPLRALPRWFSEKPPENQRLTIYLTTVNLLEKGKVLKVYKPPIWVPGICFCGVYGDFALKCCGYSDWLPVIHSEGMEESCWEMSRSSVPSESEQPNLLLNHWITTLTGMLQCKFM